MTNNDEGYSQRAINAKRLSCGILSGLLQAAIFNPWDRALYLSVKHDRKFLHWLNFKNPFAGLMQTITQRALSSGLYFPLEDIFKDRLISSGLMSSSGLKYIPLLAGNLAGRWHDCPSFELCIFAATSHSHQIPQNHLFLFQILQARVTDY